MNKDKIKKIVTSKIGIAIISGSICFGLGFAVNSSRAETEDKLNGLQEEVKVDKNKILELESKNNTRRGFCKNIYISFKFLTWILIIKQLLFKIMKCIECYLYKNILI